MQDIQLEYHFVSSEESIETTTTTNYVTEDNNDEDLVQESSVNHDQYLSDFLFEGFMPTPMVKHTFKDLPGRTMIFRLSNQHLLGTYEMKFLQA